MLRAKSIQLSFYGNHICDRVIPKGHFLKLLNKVFGLSGLFSVPLSLTVYSA